MAKRQIYTCASYGEGCSPEKPSDCLWAGRQCLSRWWSTCQSSPMSVPSLSVCLLTSLFLACFLILLFLPFVFLSLLSFLAPSCLPFFRFVSFLSWATSRSVTMELCISQPFPLLSLELTYLLTLCTAENKRVFVSVSLYYTSLFTHMLDRQIDRNTHTGEQNCGQVLFTTGEGNIEIVSE